MHTVKFMLILIIFLAGVLVACEATAPPAPEEYELLDGPIKGLTTAQRVEFLRGDIAFNDDVFTVQSGLGPLFVGTSCGSCHAGDGKGHPFVQLIRYGQSDSSGNRYMEQGGPQLQHKAIPGYLPEQIPPGATFSRLVAPAVTGLGLLDAVSDADLIALADPYDRNGDGISGRLHWNTIPEYVTLRPGTVTQNGRYISRFGKKGAIYNLLQQTAVAYNQDIGITSEFEPFDPYSGHREDPEVTTKQINDVVAYLKTLKAPLPRDPDDSDILAGKQIFSDINCSGCHVPTLRTGPSPIAALSEKEFQPYTDLLLHDMGAELDDGYTEGYASTAEWRTPPLWGLGLSPDAQGGSYFLMHDGRARTIEQAIMLHGGEGTNSRNAYRALPAAQKVQLHKFLESL